MRPIFTWLLGIATGVFLTILAIGIWNRFDGENWRLLFLGLLFMVPYLIWIADGNK